MVYTTFDRFEFSLDLAHQAGDLLLSFYRPGGIQATLKPDRTVVTQADQAVDQLILQAIEETFPGDFILSEELNPHLIDTYSAQHSVWLIDPLDGTTNFSLGLHHWGVLITHLQAGYPDITVMNFPLLNELYSARRGEGASMNGHEIHVELPSPERPLSFFVCCSRTHNRYQVRIPYKTRIIGSAAYSLCCVGRGSALIAFEAAPKVWDIAGAWLLIQEAGGIIEPYTNNSPFPLKTGVDYMRQDFPTLAAVNATLIEQSRRQIQLKPKA